MTLSKISVLVLCKFSSPQRLSNNDAFGATCARSLAEATLEDVAPPLPSRSSIEAETPARHQENSAGSVVCALPNFLGVWCIEPPRERECEGELSPSRSRG